MKPYLFSLFLLAALPALTQTPPPSRADTIYGVAMVLDTIQVFSFVADTGTTPGHYEPTNQLTSAIIPAYAISKYILIVDGKGDTRPRVNDVRYYTLETCEEIPYRILFAFKQQ